MLRLTLADRAAAYAAAFPGRPPLQLVRESGREVLYGTWMGGADYRQTSALYGAYPKGYLDRVMCLFPDHEADPMKPLHVFSGSLPRSLAYTTVDVNADRRPDFCANVYDLPSLFTLAGGVRYRFGLVLADPPYSAADAAKYETSMVDRRRAMAALAQVTRVGGHLVWLDCVWPIHSKRDWVTVGRITLIRSTNHRVRLVSIFQRVAS